MTTDSPSTSAARKLPPEMRRELRALERITKALKDVDTPGRKWLRDLLTQDLEARGVR